MENKITQDRATHIRTYLESRGASVTKIVDVSDEFHTAATAQVIKVPRRLKDKQFKIGDITVSVVSLT